MEPCWSCARHLRTTETACPFCGAEQRAERAPLSAGVRVLVASLVLGMSACSSAPDPSAEGSTTTDPSTTTTMTMTSGSESGASETSTGTSDGTSATTDDTMATGVFYGGADVDFGPLPECDPSQQDCPEGEKCVPYSSIAGNWDGNKCVPATGEGGAGDPCVYSSTLQASDDCDAEHMCWNMQEVDGQQLGECMPFCGGTFDDPICGPDSACLIANDDSIFVCAPACDPLAQDCDAGEMCGWASDNFLCMTATPGRELAEPCGFANDCAAGALCISGEVLQDCNGSACCAELCSLETPSCADPSYECIPLIEEGMQPPGLFFEGICVVPEGCENSCTELVFGSTLAAIE